MPGREADMRDQKSKAGALSPWQELRLTLSMLLIHHRRLGIPAEVESLPDPSVCRLPDVKVSRWAVDRLRTRISAVVAAVENRGRKGPRAAQGSDHKRDAWQRHAVRLASSDGEWGQAQALADALLRLPRVATPEFEAYSSLVLRSAMRFRRTEAFLFFRTHLRRPLPSTLMTAVEHQYEPAFLQRRFRTVLSRFRELLGVLQHAEALVVEGCERRRLILLMIDCYYRCRSLFLLVDDLRRSTSETHPLHSHLTVFSSGLKMQAGRALKQELRHIDAETDVERYGERVERAVGLLATGFEQAYAELEEFLVPEAPATDLAALSKSRRRQAFNLLDEIWRLQLAARRAEGGGDRAGFEQIFQLFRQQCVPLLFHVDRRIVEQFAREFEGSNSSSVPFVLHRLQIYLSTLLGQVKNRGVLTAEEMEPAKAVHG